MNNIYSVKEVAKMLGRPESFVRLKIKSGHLKAVPFGHIYRIEEQSFQDFLDYCKQEGNVEYSPYEHIDGITLEEFCKSMKVGKSLARNVVQKLVENGTIKVFKVKNKLILPKDIYEKMGLIQNYCLESKGESSTIKASINTPSLFADDTNHNVKLPLTNIVESNKPNEALNIVKEIQQLNDMVKSGTITQDEFNTLKKALMTKL
jgi:excisionase family DNA binding protein